MRLLVSLMIACLVGCDRGDSKGNHAGNDGWVPVPPASQPASQPTHPGAWSAERITENPDGYRRWWEEQAAAALAKEKARMEELESRRAAFERSWQTLSVNVAQAENLRDRLRQARDAAASTPRLPLPATTLPTTQSTSSPASPTAAPAPSAPAVSGPQPRPLRVSGRNVDPARVPELLERLDAYARRNRQLADRARDLTDAYAGRLTAAQFNLDRIERVKERAFVEIALVKEAGSALTVDFESMEKQLATLEPATRPASALPDLLEPPPQPLPTTLPTTQPIELTTTDKLLNL